MTKMATILDPFPRVTLASLPTPLEPLPRLSAFLGGPQILVKRDDQTGLAMGGNKARKLEYLVEHARALGCDTLVTIGGLQSNHERVRLATIRLFLNLVICRKSNGPSRIRTCNQGIMSLFPAVVQGSNM